MSSPAFAPIVSRTAAARAGTSAPAVVSSVANYNKASTAARPGAIPSLQANPATQTFQNNLQNITASDRRVTDYTKMAMQPRTVQTTGGGGQFGGGGQYTRSIPGGFAAPGGKDIGSQIVRSALNMVGTPYALGGGGIGVRSSRGIGKGTQNVVGVDCSGLTSYVFGQFGIKLPRYSNHQTQVGYRTNINNARPGDIVGWSRGGHVAIYAGNGYIIESPRPGKFVQVRRLGRNESVFAVRIAR